MVIRLFSRFAFVLLAYLLVSAGCGPSPAAPQAATPSSAVPQAATPSSAAPQAVTPSSAVPQAATPSAPSKAASPSGTLRVAISTFSQDTVDPMQSGSGPLIDIVGPLFDQLVGVGPEGKIGPAVAERWELSPDGLAWTFYLRHGLQFQDKWGEVTADDVKFSLDRIISPESKSLWAGTLTKNIKGIDVVDPYTVRVRTNATMLDLPYMLSPLSSVESDVLPKRYIAEKGVDEFRNHPIGSGPWKFVQHVPGNKFEYQAVTDPDFYKSHYRPMPNFERLVISMVPEESARTAMLQTGEADLANVSAEKVDEMQAVGLRLAPVPMASQLKLHLWDTYRPEVAKMPTGDLRIRQALSLAINREEVVKFLLKGYGNATMMPTRLFPFVADIDADYWKAYGQKAYRYDPTEAKRLLSEARYDGSEITFFSYAQAAAPIEPKLVEAIAGYWQAVGVKTKVTPIEFGSFTPMQQQYPHNAKLFGAASILQAPARYLATSSIQLDFYSKGYANLMNDPQVDKLVDGLLGEPNEAKRREGLKQVIQLTADSMTGIPIVYTSGLYGLSKNVQEWKPIPGTTYILGLTYETTTRRTQ